MKKIYFLLFLSCITVQHAFSQQIRFGVFANPGLSWFSSDVSRIETSGDRLGINFGLMADNFFAPQYAFATGLSIHTTGGAVNYHSGKTLSTSDGDIVLPKGTDVTFMLQYLQVPLGLKFRTVEIGNLTYFADLGFDPMINIKARASFNASGGRYNDTGVSEEVNTFYLAYHLSAGVEYHLVGNTMLMGGLSFMNGFTNVIPDGQAKTVLNCFELRLGVFF